MQEESLTTPHPILIWSCDSHVISCDLTYDDASCQIDLTLADIPGTTEQLNNAFGFRHTETLKVGEEEGGKKNSQWTAVSLCRCPQSLVQEWRS